MDTLRVLLLVFCLLALGYLIMKVGGDRWRMYECEKWRDEAKEFAGYYYLSPYQAEQCDYYGIKINAPVKEN
jgi:hypothetical protein